MALYRGDAILGFMAGWACDCNGRMHGVILEWPDRRLEECHDYIQWLFPLHESSDHSSCAPILDKETADRGIQTPEVVRNLKLARKRMEKFYGIDSDGDSQVQDRWCRDGNHNLLRITRIIRAMRLFGMEDDAELFYAKVMGPADRRGISQSTLGYWEAARACDPWTSMKK